ncbi:MAG: hypothetical protein HY713_04580 [candidate division NC10 bacterium]|nr:hypothetical protein [candidate division NC10 bacterium]
MSDLDIFIHSPGGLPDAAASIVELLRERFAHIGFIVPFFAKSAATMLVLSGNQVLMTPAAELGPIDPQMPVVLPNGVVMFSPAYALKEQYERAHPRSERKSSSIAWLGCDPIASFAVSRMRNRDQAGRGTGKAVA